MKITFFDTNSADQDVLQGLVSALPNAADLHCSFVNGSLTAESAGQSADADAVCVFVKSSIDAEVLKALPNLKLICTMSTGFDNIDLAAAEQRQITVCNVPGYGSRTVAEYVFSLILGISRKTFAATRSMKETHSFDTAAFEGFDLYQKTIGIVGTGKIGLNVARIAKGFGMKILATDAFPNVAGSSEIGFEYLPLEELLSKSDVVSLHVPYMKSTHHLINLDNIMKVKPGALLINTARGEVVETQAIVAALDKGLLAGVGLDVIEGERDVADEWELLVSDPGNPDQHSKSYKTLLEEHLLIDCPEVFITPHIAFFSREAKGEILKTTVNNLASYVAGTAKNKICPQP